MWNQLCNSGTFGRRKVEVDVSRMFPKPLEQFLSRGAENAVNLVDLVQLIRAWEEWKETNYFEEYAADTPDIHLIVVITVCEQAFRCTIPARRDVLSIGLFAIDAAT